MAEIVKAPEDKHGKTRRRLIELEESYRLVQGDESPSGVNERARLRMELKRLDHDHIHPGEDWVEVNVPTQVDGNPFRINDTAYEGLVVVQGCVASQLLWMIQENQKMDQDRMKENGRNVILGSTVDRARTIQMDR